MKKYIVIFSVLFMSSALMAQENTRRIKELQKGSLIEVTYFYPDGKLEQKGAFNLNGKPHGIWISYNVEGNKISRGRYRNGKKVGKWKFWSESLVYEVNFNSKKENYLYTVSLDTN